MSMKASQRESSSMPFQAIVERPDDPPGNASIHGGRSGPVVDHDDALLHVGRQDLAMVVRALVVIEEEPLDPYEAVELDPLAKVFRMVPVYRADGQVWLHLLI